MLHIAHCTLHIACRMSQVTLLRVALKPQARRQNAQPVGGNVLQTTISHLAISEHDAKCLPM